MESSPEKEVFSEEETEQEGVGTPSHALPRGPVSLPCHGNATLTGVTVSSQKMWGLYSRAAQRWEAVQGTEPDPGKDGFASLCGLPVVLWPTGIFNQGDLMVPEWEGAFIPIKKNSEVF